MRINWIVLTAAAALSACSTIITQEEVNKPLVPDVAKPDDGKGPGLRPSIFLRSHRDYANEITQPIRARGVPFLQVMELAAPGYSVMPMDSAVNLYLPVTMTSGGTPLDRLLHALEEITGYSLTVRGKTIEVQAFLSKEWLLPMFSAESSSEASVSGAGNSGSSSGSGGGGGSGGSSSGVSSGGSSRSVTATFRNEVDDWDGLVNYVEALIGASGGAPAPVSIDSTGEVGAIGEASLPTTPQVVGNQAIGYLRAYGEASKIRAADRYINGLIKHARRQVRLDVRSIEVSFSNSKSRGINWNTAINTIFDNALGSAGVALGADYSVAGVSTDGSFNIAAQAQNTDDSIQAMINFLASYGDVELRNEPQVTVFNGRTAYIGSGQEFGYVASIEQTVSNGTVVSTPEIARILIGVELAITPRVVDGNNILLEVVPIISTFQGFDTFNVGESTFSQPRIVLNQLATQVIVQSGRPIHLGGLMTSRINEAVRGLPLEQGSILSEVMGPIFSGKSNVVERRELMLVVTPYLSNI